MKLDFVIYANSNHTGFGTHARGVMKALCLAGKNIAFVPVQPIAHQIIDSPWLEWLERSLRNREYLTGKDPAIMIHHAESMIRFCGKPRCGFAIFETNKIHAKDIVYYKTLDKILVPSQWGKQVLIDNGLDGNEIMIMPEGYDPENYYVKHSIDEVIHRWKQRGYLSFFHCGKYEDRKSSTMIIHAFQQAVNESGVMAQLYMKCENPFNGIWFEEFEHARGDCEFIHTYGQGNIENMDILYHNFDFGLYASKGEAFGLPIIESIACGLPTITSNWSGQSEYLKEYPRELLITKGTQELANDGMFFNGNHGNWIVPDYDQLVEKIKYVLENAEDIYRNARQKCVDSVKDFTWKNAVRRLIDG